MLYMGRRPLGKRTKGEIYITGGKENQAYHKAQYFDGKRFMYRNAFLDKQKAERYAKEHRDLKPGNLARVVPRMVWINHAGWELGMEKVQGYILYVHYGKDEKSCLCGSGKSTFTFEGKRMCADCAPICIGD